MRNRWYNYRKRTREELDIHEKEINRLTREIDLLRRTWNAESTIYFPRKSMASKRSIKEVLTCLIDHLNLEIETIPAEPPGVRFTKKGD